MLYHYQLCVVLVIDEVGPRATGPRAGGCAGGPACLILHIYVYIYIYREREMCIYIYIYTCIYIYIYNTYIHISDRLHVHAICTACVCLPPVPHVVEQSLQASPPNCSRKAPETRPFSSDLKATHKSKLSELLVGYNMYIYIYIYIYIFAICLSAIVFLLACLLLLEGAARRGAVAPGPSAERMADPTILTSRGGIPMSMGDFQKV